MMIRKCLTICFLLLCFSHLKAQQFGLFNTKTLFDGFENPAQKTFVLDSSRQFASNFFLPYFGINALSKGNEEFLRRVIVHSKYNTEGLPLNTGKSNTFFQNSNFYLLNFKIFKSYKYHKELGLSWQLRSDANFSYTNETLAILDTYRRFLNDDGREFNNAFNNRGYQQSYHQFSLTYRENYNKRLAFGAKLSLLSGIAYNQLVINKSSISLESPDGPLSASLNGHYKASFLKTKDLSKKDAYPLFKNPGAAISLGTTYTAKNGLFIMANIKDLGLIRWNKNSYNYKFGNANSVYIENLQSLSSTEIQDTIINIVIKDKSNSAFYTPTNAKIDFLISKTFDFYTPSFIASKNLFYKGGDIVMVNKFYYSNFSFSAIPAYNLNNFVVLGVQGMYQTPNFEVFLGSDNLLKSVALAKNNENVGAYGSYINASFYLGASIKFGYVVEHPQNSSYMPGVGDEEQSFFKRMFSFFKKGKK